MKPWKELEKYVARCLDGSRVIRERWDKRDCDVRHAYFTIECKYRATFGDWYNEALDRVRELDHSIQLLRSASDFVIEALEQAKQYGPTKPAIAVIKKKGLEYDDSLVFMRYAEFPNDLVKHVTLTQSPLISFTGLKEFTQYWQREKYKHLPEPVRYEGD